MADQAVGLRKLFSGTGPRVLPVVAAEGAHAGREAMALARSLNAAGLRCLIVDAGRAGFERRIASLAAEATREDWILVAAGPEHAEAASAIAAGAEVALAVPPGRDGRTAAYAVIKRIVHAGATRAFRVVSPGEAAQRLDAVARRFLGATVQRGGDPRAWACATFPNPSMKGP